MICKHCGFVSYDWEDMCLHLGQGQKYDIENCKKKSILLRHDEVEK